MTAVDIASLLFVVISLLGILDERWFDNRALAVPTRGGLRGGISMAVALSLPEGEPRTTILTAT